MPNRADIAPEAVFVCNIEPNDRGEQPDILRLVFLPSFHTHQLPSRHSPLGTFLFLKFLPAGQVT
jgi:hypothetical protein